MRSEQPVDSEGDIRCAEAIELVTLHLDNALDDRDRRLFERHVDACTGCTRYVVQIRQTIRLTRRVLDEHMSVARQPQNNELRAAFVARRRRSM